MNPEAAKRIFLKLFIGFLILTAGIAILSILSGTFGSFELKVLATTFSISAASICSMSCAAFIESKKAKELGIIGIVSSALAATLVIGGIWMEISEKGFWKITISTIVFAIALAHAFLLILPDLDPVHRWVQKIACLSIVVLSCQILSVVWLEMDNESYYKLLAATSIIVVLLTLVVPILLKVRKGPSEETRTLVLTENPDGSFCDESGKYYRVAEVEPEETETRGID